MARRKSSDVEANWEDAKQAAKDSKEHTTELKSQRTINLPGDFVEGVGFKGFLTDAEARRFKRTS